MNSTFKKIQVRSIAFIALLLPGIGCNSSKQASSISGKLNGTWIPSKQEIGGTVLPDAAFEKQRLIINDSTYTVIAESVDKGVVKISGNKMDIYGKDGVNTGKHFTAIYKYETGGLTICYNLKGDSTPKFLTLKASLYFFFRYSKKSRQNSAMAKNYTRENQNTKDQNE